MAMQAQLRTEHMAQPNTGHAAQPESVLESVAGLGKPVIVEIEFTQIRFRSKIALRDGQVIVAKPSGLKGVLTAESYIRMRVPDGHGEEIRLRIVAPDADAGDGSSAFICRPAEGPVISKRAADRYSVAHDERLRLDLKGRVFPLVDVSLKGLRISLPAAQTYLDLPIGHNLGPGNLMFGAEVWVRIGQLIPRNRQERTIGCEFKALMDDMSLNNLMALVDSLKQTPVAVIAAVPGRGRGA
ncbi:MAG: hypothetical protein ACHQZQ_04905 [SAR324 cluster bacterium]